VSENSPIHELRETGKTPALRCVEKRPGSTWKGRRKIVRCESSPLRRTSQKKKSDVPKTFSHRKGSVCGRSGRQIAAEKKKKGKLSFLRRSRPAAKRKESKTIRLSQRRRKKKRNVGQPRKKESLPFLTPAGTESLASKLSLHLRIRQRKGKLESCNARRKEAFKDEKKTIITGFSLFA